ncbi:reverse transcriptase [Quillaja saponaria]|uniref:Reverse transcriptase n=1 Tax=Quillaja saponaria TaxID=32244 RepID=A0AAD7KPB4_QUISA|nr:reverse transcriptase [Quillaja saponaria]
MLFMHQFQMGVMDDLSLEESQGIARLSETQQPSMVVTSYKDTLMDDSQNSPNKFESDWKDVGEDDLDFEERSIVDGEEEDPLCPTIKISAAEKRRLRKPWRNCLIIKLLGKHLGYRFLFNKLTNLWQPKGELKLIDVGNDYYLVKLSAHEDYNKVLDEGPWLVADHYVTLQKWMHDFDNEDDFPTCMAVW